jgi:hypothetical protein
MDATVRPAEPTPKLLFDITVDVYEPPAQDLELDYRLHPA